jgi:hypothetical protein
MQAPWQRQACARLQAAGEAEGELGGILERLAEVRACRGRVHSLQLAQRAGPEVVAVIVQQLRRKSTHQFFKSCATRAHITGCSGQELSCTTHARCTQHDYSTRHLLLYGMPNFTHSEMAITPSTTRLLHRDIA